MRYNLNQLALISGLTTRTLRNYLRQGALRGEKLDGVWQFDEEDLDAFFADHAAQKAMTAHRHALVWDFLADAYKKTNRACVILDLPVSAEEAAEASRFFAQAVCEMGHDIELRCGQERDLLRIVLSGAEEPVADILRAWYGR